MSPAIKREDLSIDAATAGPSSTIAQFYHQLTGQDLMRRSSSGEARHDHTDVADDSRIRDDRADTDDDEDNDDEDTINDEPCDLRLLTPATCLREIYPPGDYAAHSSTASMVPYLGGAALPGLAETLISNITKMPAYKNSPAGSSSTGTTSGMPTGAATIPALRNIRGPGPSAGGSGGGSSGSPTGTSSILGPGTSNQTTPGGAYSCIRCGNSYARPHSLNRHIRFECGVEPKFECPVCHKKSKHKHNLVLHMRTHQQR